MENAQKEVGAPKKKKSPIVPIVLIIVVVAAVCFCIFSVFAVFASILSSTALTINENILTQGQNDQKIVVIEIHGVITSTPISDLFSESTTDMTTTIINKLDRAKNDSNVKAVILDIDSPGGEVYASELIYNKIIEVQKSGKKIISLFRSTAASGGYYVAAPSDHIVASETTITGSIGVRIETQDLKGLYEKLGIKTYDIVNSEGNYKVLSNDLSDQNSEAYKILESILDDVYNQFVEVIVEGRSMSRSEVVALADGRVYSGKKAQEIGLVDTLGYYENAVDQAKDIAQLNDPQIIEYTDADSYLSDIGISLRQKLGSMLELVPDNKRVETKLLYILNL